MTSQEILELIIAHTRDILPQLASHTFTPGDRLIDLGANSIDRVEIVAMTLNSLSLRLPLVATKSARNIGELAELLYANL